MAWLSSIAYVCEHSEILLSWEHYTRPAGTVHLGVTRNLVKRLGHLIHSPHDPVDPVSSYPVCTWQIWCLNQSLHV